jgi:hypothetical protein
MPAAWTVRRCPLVHPLPHSIRSTTARGATTRRHTEPIAVVFYVAAAIGIAACNRSSAASTADSQLAAATTSAAVAAAAVQEAGGAIPPRSNIGIAAAADPKSIALLQRLGIHRVRTTIIWNNYLDPRHFADDRSTPVASGGHTPAEFVAMDLAAFRNAGIEPLVVVHTPPFGMSLTTGITEMPKFMASLASRFRGMRWEILNEMTGEDGFNAGWFQASNKSVSDSVRGDWYGRLLAPVYDAIKARDPTATVVTGGIDRGLRAFYAGLRARAPHKYDVFAVHSYGPPAAPGFKEKSIEARRFLNGVPLWCTEVGSAIANEAAQASDLQALLDDNEANDRYDRVYLYTLMGDESYALVRRDGSLRRSATMIANRSAR